MWNSISSWQLCHVVRVKKCIIHVWQHCRRMYRCVLLYTWLFLRVRPSQKCPLQFMSIYSNENIRKIVKLSPHKFLHLVQNLENYGVYSMWSRSALPVQHLLWIYCRMYGSFSDKCIVLALKNLWEKVLQKWKIFCGVGKLCCILTSWSIGCDF